MNLTQPVGTQKATFLEKLSMLGLKCLGVFYAVLWVFSGFSYAKNYGQMLPRAFG